MVVVVRDSRLSLSSGRGWAQLTFILGVCVLVAQFLLMRESSRPGGEMGYEVVARSTGIVQAE